MGSAGKILIVDDDPDIRDILGTAIGISDLPYGVVQAQDGLDALHALHADAEISLVMLDMMMPTMDGSRFMRTLQDDDRLSQIPVIFLTTLERGSLAALLAFPNAKGYLQKPISPMEVPKLIRRVLAL